MRLFNSITFQFKEFIGKNVPKYAILSHTWEEEEVSFKDMGYSSCKEKKGYRKIEMTCRLASQAGLEYVWLDTCCIDKSSSAELTEAINSMYRWYQRSEVCYAFLSDLPASERLGSALKRCRWFSRGWTLQELIAPEHIHFLDQDWRFRGSNRDLVGKLSEITTIGRSILTHDQSLSLVPVAQKMSWAAHRQTTRIEDEAYFLLGIFNVNMPLLYGEEEKAFRRLQEEILKSTPDYSLFAWVMPRTLKNHKEYVGGVVCGILAETVFAFSGCESLTRLPPQRQRHFSVSNSGLRIPIYRTDHGYILPLECSLGSKRLLAIGLTKCGPGQFFRTDSSALQEISHRYDSYACEEKYVLTRISEMSWPPTYSLSDTSLFLSQLRPHVLKIGRLPSGMKDLEVYIEDQFDEADQLFFHSESHPNDCSALKIIGHSFECMFYALGWSLLEPKFFQCTLVDYRLHGREVDGLQSYFWEKGLSFVTAQFLHKLREAKIPKSNSASFGIPGSTSKLQVSFKVTLVQDSNICPNKFWRVDFSDDVYEVDQLPPPHHEKWKSL